MDISASFVEINRDIMGTRANLWKYHFPFGYRRTDIVPPTYFLVFNSEDLPGQSSGKKCFCAKDKTKHSFENDPKTHRHTAGVAWRSGQPKAGKSVPENLAHGAWWVRWDQQGQGQGLARTPAGVLRACQPCQGQAPRRVSESAGAGTC